MFYGILSKTGVVGAGVGLRHTLAVHMKIDSGAGTVEKIPLAEIGSNLESTCLKLFLNMH